MHVMPVFVCCHTNYWTQQMVNGFTKHFPNIKMLAIDNNPYTYQNIDSDGHGYHKNPSWNISCEIERKFINQHPDIFVLPAFNYASHVQKANTHGKCLDIAVKWCKENNVDVMLCIEPDSIITGTKWFFNLLYPIEKEGYFNSHYGLYEKGDYGVPVPCDINPTMWLTKSINVTFQEEWRGVSISSYDEEDSLNKYFEDKQKKTKTKIKRFIESNVFWDLDMGKKQEVLNFCGFDTCQKMWFNNFVKCKSKALKMDQCIDFVHLWKKSHEINWKLNCNKEPLLLGEWKYI